MNVTFDPTKQYLVFNPADQKEASSLTTFPGLQSASLYRVCPAVLPIAHNLVARLQDKFKKLTLANDVHEWLEQDFKLRSLPPEFYYHTSPLDFQEIALRYAYTLGSSGLLLDPGMGKSKVVLDFIFLMQFLKVIIVCPKPLMFVWEDEIQKHRPELSFYSVQTTNWEDEAPNIKAAQVTIINYNKVSTFKHRLKTIGYQFIHLDEFLIKDNSTLRTQDITELSRVIPYRMGGSGTLINNSPLDAYPPIRYLQPSLVGGNFANFKNRYTVERESKLPDGRTMKQVVAFRNQDEIRSILESCCIVMTKEEWLKLPPKTFHDIHVSLSQQQKDAYYSLLRNYRTEVEDQDGSKVEVEVDNPLVMLAKLSQISNGFVYTSTETEEQASEDLLPSDAKATAKRKTTFFKEQPKIEALRNLLTTKLAGRKAIIWFNMSAELELIKGLLDQLGHSYLTIKGGEKKIGEKVRSFNRDPSIQWLVCQARSVNYGITVMGSSRKDLEDSGIEVLPGIDTAVYCQVFCSLSFSLEVYLQQIDRTHRIGAQHDCEYYRIFATTPVDRKLREALEDKLTLRREMLIDVANTLLSEEGFNITT